MNHDTIPALAQFIEPAPVAFTPDAPGWYTLEGVLAGLVLCILLLVYRHYRKNRYRRSAVLLLETAQKQLPPTGEYTQLVYHANMLAKQISIRLYGREQTASLKGSSWIEHLNRSCPKADFTEADTRLLEALYDSSVKADAQQAAAFVEKMKYWIKKHRTRL